MKLDRAEGVLRRADAAPGHVLQAGTRAGKTTGELGEVGRKHRIVAAGQCLFACPGGAQRELGELLIGLCVIRSDGKRVVQCS